jgi:hypothetical protein
MDQERLMMELEHKIAMQQAAERWRVASLMEMISMRLFGGRPDKLPFPFAQAHKAGERVFIFIVKGDEGMMLEDEAKMFPSDGLVTQLRLLLEDMPRKEAEARDTVTVGAMTYFGETAQIPPGWAKAAGGFAVKVK